MLGRLCNVGASAAMVLAFSRALPAQPHVCSTSVVDSSSSGEAAWSPPLDRSITVRATNLSLRDALDRVATAARIRLSYSAEQVPLDRAVCVSADASPAGRVLADLLTGTNVAAVVVGSDQVVLTPRPRPTHADGPAMAPTVGVLDRVVVTGTASGAPAKELSVGLDVLNGRTLARENTNTISDALDSYVPGVWSWAQSPSNMLSSYASIRGASSFGLSYPKIYIDGIEVANPLLLSRFSPGAIDHIEVIRGPQGAALYGADAISGVVNIVTRHDGANGDGPQADIRSSAGVSQSAFTKNVVTQDHSFSLVTGTSTRSMDLNVSGSTMGAFVPNGYSRDIMASGGGRIVGNTGSLTTTARLFFEQAGVPSSPLIQTPSSSLGGPPTTSTPNSSPQTVTEYTFGATALRAPGSTWVDSFVVGVDGYRLANVQTNYTPVPSIVDSALRAAQGGADRVTLRASRVFHFNADDPTRASITLSAEHATLRASTMMSSAFVSGSGNRGPGSQGGPGGEGQDSRENLLTPLVTWQNSTGVTAQANAAINNALFFTSGVRLEEDSRLAPGDRLATLPMFGVAGVNDIGPFTMKLRAAYGRGIRPPSTTQRWQMWQPQSAAQAALGPEVQSGTEVGLDVMLRQTLTRTADSLRPAGVRAHPAGAVRVGQRVDRAANAVHRAECRGDLERRLGARSYEHAVARDDERVVRGGGQPSPQTGAGIHRRPRNGRPDAASPGDHGELRRDVDGRRVVRVDGWNARFRLGQLRRSGPRADLALRYRIGPPDGGAGASQFLAEVHGRPAPARERVA